MPTSILTSLLVVPNLIPEAYQQWVVLGLIIWVILSLFREWLRAELTFFLAVVILIAGGILQPEEFLAGFANRQIATIIVLVLITSVLRRNFNLDNYFDYAFRGVTSGRSFLVRMSAGVAILSSFLNNTPVVAVMTPYVYNWCKKFGVHPSKLLIPLSFSTILGGMITVLGTSTNLVLNGFLEENKLPQLGFTDFFYLGVLITAMGITYLATIGYKILPENKEAFDDVKAKAPEYLVETYADPDGKLCGQTVQESGLGSLRGTYLIELHRDGEVISPIPPEIVLEPRDVLFFMGKSDNILELVNAGIGLRLPQHDEDQEVVEAVIPANSLLAGKPVQKVGFKDNYDAELLAIHRNGEKLKGKISEQDLQHGDLLLLSISSGFVRNADAIRDLYVLSKTAAKKPANPLNLRIFALVVFGAIALALSGVLSLLTSLLMILSMALVLGLFSVQDITKSIEADLVLILASALALGNALINTGAAELVANQFMQILLPFGKEVLLIGLFVMTVILTSFVTNVAAVSVMFPVAFALSQELGIAGQPFYVAIAFAASAAFITPVSYQTNWMVYGPGSYTPKDFYKVGIPLAVLHGILCISFILLRYSF